MTLNLIDQEIIDIFFKFYKKDFKKADEDLQKNLNKKIAENIAKIENDEDSKIMILQTFSDYSFSFFHVVAKFGLSEDLKKIIWYHSSSINTRIKNIDYNLKTWNLIKDYVVKTQKYLLDSNY